jgi:hypothetical protein
MRDLRGQQPVVDPPRATAPQAAASSPSPKRASAWAILEIEPGASVAAIKRAYRRRALETHPDRGGDPEIFRAVQRAYERAVDKQQKQDKRPKKKRQ